MEERKFEIRKVRESELENICPLSEDCIGAKDPDTYRDVCSTAYLTCYGQSRKLNGLKK